MRRALLVTTILCAADALPALAQDRPHPTAAPAQVAQATAARRFDLPAQPLASALVRFSEASGLQLFFDATMARALRSAPVAGTMTPEEALRRLLAGTHLTYRFTNATTVTLEKLPQTGDAGAVRIDPVTVEGRAWSSSTAMIGNLAPEYAGGQVATGGRLGLLGNRDVMDAPFSITSYTAKTIQDQQARTIADVVVNDPSVRVNFPRGSFSDTYMIRGFTNNSDLTFNGMYGLTSSFLVMTEVAERVEVLKGPNALLNGISLSGSVGGAINIVPKRAGDEPLTRLTTSYFSDSQFGAHVDVGRRFGPQNELGVRVNGVYRNGDTPVDRNRQELGLGTVAVDYQGTRARLSLDLGYQAQNADAGLRGVMVAPGIPVPSAPDAGRNYTQPWSFMNIRDTYGLAQGEFDLTDDLTAFAAFGARHATSDGLFSTPRITSADGGFTETPFYFPSYTNVMTGEVGLRGRVETGPVRHELVVSGTTLHREDGSAFTFFTGTPSNLFDPSLAQRPSLSGLPGPGDIPKTAESDLTSLAFADTLSVLDDRIRLTLGLRHQVVRTSGFDAASGAKITSYNESRLTPAAGLVLKPWENVSLYANYIEGLTQGPVAPAGTVNAGAVFAPIVSKQYEAGVKLDFGSFATTLGVFQITQPSGAIDPATSLFEVDGEQRNRGIELNVFGEPFPGIRLLGGAMLLDGQLTKTAGGINDGNTAIGAPDLQLNLGGEWDVPFLPGLTLSARSIYTSAQYLDAANTQKIPGWTRFDVGARYAIETGGKPIIVRADIQNLFDKNYWASTGGGLLSLGPARAFLVSTSFEF